MMGLGHTLLLHLLCFMELSGRSQFELAIMLSQHAKRLSPCMTDLRASFVPPLLDLRAKNRPAAVGNQQHDFDRHSFQNVFVGRSCFHGVSRYIPEYSVNSELQQV